MSDSNLVLLSYAKETTYGAVPAGPPTLLDVRHTGESLQSRTETVQSREIRADRRIQDILRIGANGQGDVNFEVSVQSHDDWYEAALLSNATWTAESTKAGSNLGVDGATDKFTSTDGWPAAFTPGGIILTAGFNNAANNGYWRILSKSGNDLFVTNGTALVTEAAGAAVTILQGGYITDGTTLPSFTLEKKYSDLANQFDLGTGFCINMLDLNLPSKGVINGRFGWLGQDFTPRTVTVGAGNTPVNANPIMTVVNNVTAMFEGDILAANLTDLTLRLNNNLRMRDGEIGKFGPQSMGKGSCAYSGTLRAYMQDSTILTKYAQFAESGLIVVMRDNNGKSLILDLAALKYTDGKRLAQGKDGDVYVELTFEGKIKTTTGFNYMLRMSRMVA